MASSDKVRWGILGPGRIAARLMKDAEHGRNFTVVAAAGRSQPRAQEFAAEFGIARAYASHEELLADRDVDAVYIASPNSLHHSQTMVALAAGKHVLCEKPYTRRSAEVGEAFDAADAAGLLLMEAFMWRHLPATRRFTELLPEIGELRAIRSTFSFVIESDGDVRLRSDLDGGALMDVGCYATSGSRLIAGVEPVEVFGRQVIGPSGVDVAFSGMLAFPSGVVSEILAGFGFDHRSLEAIGSRGTLRLADPWHVGIGLELNGVEQQVARDDPYRLEVENFSDAILGRGKQLLGRADALGQARAIEAMYRSAESGQPVRL
jgi:D-xylose 1-dehydrogenase (NADP+, D-xylono-1,5-lactone-forming)